MARTDYHQAGFNGFFNRSIGAVQSMSSLSGMASSVSNTSRELNYDQSQTSGNLGSSIKVGSVLIDGVNGRISVFEGSDEVVRIGELDG